MSSTIDFDKFFAPQKHVPRDIIVHVESSAFSTAGRMLEHEALKMLFEMYPRRVTGLRTGVRLHFADDAPYLKNETAVVNFEFQELYDRRSEQLLRANMDLFCRHPEAGGVELLFIEPDATGTQVLAVWYCNGMITSSGESDAYRGIERSPSDGVIFDIPFQGEFFYNRPSDAARAQVFLNTMNNRDLRSSPEAVKKLLDAMHPSRSPLATAVETSSDDKPFGVLRGLTPAETNASMDRAMEQLSEVASTAVQSMANSGAPANVPPIRIDVISHANCLDGMAAAWVVKQFYERRNADARMNTRFDVHIHFTDYHLPLPELPLKTNIFMVDFCPNDVGVVKDLLRNCYSLTILDHHPKTRGVIMAVKEWAHEEGIASRFDADFSETKSGALLAWHYLMEGPAPELIQAISDRDLWQFKLPHTKPLCEALMTYGMTMNGFSACMDDRSLEAMQELVERGNVLIQGREVQIDWVIENTLCVLEGKALVEGKVETFELLAVNGSRPLASQACDTMVERYPDYPAYICYWDIEGASKRAYSIRATDGDLAQAIARFYGGDGHRKAAGFVLPMENALKVIPTR